MDWTKLSVGISALWLIILMARMAIYSAPFASTPEGELFVMALNVFLVIGIVVVGYSLFRQFFRYTAARLFAASTQGFAFISFDSSYARLYNASSSFGSFTNWNKFQYSYNANFFRPLR